MQKAASFARLAWIVLAVNLVVMVWGAFVRASGSGAGCGSHWPLCNGQVLPKEASTATLIELTHRVTSGLAFLLVAFLLFRAWRAFPRGHQVRQAAVTSMILMIGEAAIGAGLVLFELVADNATMARALFMAVHLGNTFLMLAALTLTAVLAERPSRWHWRTGAPRAAVLSALFLTLLIGISGAVAALGDTLFPAESLAAGLAQDLSPSSHILIQLRTLHPLFAVIGAFFLLTLPSTLRRIKPAFSWARWLSGAVLVQMACGVINLLLLAPIPLQLIHLLLADIVWILLVLCSFHALAEPENHV